MERPGFLKMRKLEGERLSLERKLFLMGRMLPGSLIEQKIKCGKKYCRCAEGVPHGPYYYLSRKIRGETKMTYLTNQKDLIENARAYREFQKGMRRIREIGREIERILGEVRKKQLITP